MEAFMTRIHHRAAKTRQSISAPMQMAQISQTEAQRAIDSVVATLRKDPAANNDLGRLEKVTVVLGYGR